MTKKSTLLKFSQPLLKPQPYYKDDEIGLSIGVVEVDENIEKCQSLTPSSCAFISLISGRAKIHNSDSDPDKSQTYITGESFVLPPGFINQEYFLHQLAFLVIYSPKPSEPFTPSQDCHHLVSINEDADTPWQETSDGFRKKVQYQSTNQSFTAGVWQGKDFKTGMINFPYNEFFIIQKGCLVCTDEKGNKHNIQTGEALFVPQGVRCAWQVEGSITLHFVQIKA